MELLLTLPRINTDDRGMLVNKSQENLSDDELLRLLQNGDQSAFAILYRRRQQGIFRFALQMCGSRAHAEDITQEVFLVLIRESHRYEPARGSLNAFLFGIARNHLLRRLERERFYAPLCTDDEQELEVEERTEGLLEQLSRNETVEQVRKAVLSLPERYREVVVLCELEEMSYAETAEVLGCAIGTVRSRLHRARLLLIEKLRPARTSSPEGAQTARCFA